MMVSRIILIRHAETSWNLKRRYCGHNDIPLNIRGIKQARNLRSRLKANGIYKVYSSDMKRAMQTANILFGNNCAQKNHELREMHFGIFEGLAYKEIMKRYPSIYRKWLDNPYETSIPKGENLRRFERRIGKAFKKIISLNKNKTVAVISHGGAISIFINSILKTDNFWGYIPKTATFSVIEYENNKGVIKSFNQ